MISVQEARNLIAGCCKARKIKETSLQSAGGYVLAENLCAPFDSPHFNQSAMDGYAFSYEDWDGKSELEIAGEAQAGNNFYGVLSPGTAIRIFTGAELPPGADTIVIQENVEKTENRIIIKDKKLVKGSNIRLRGSQTKKGDEILKEGHLLTPASVSFLAGFGLNSLKIFANPAVHIIATGKELIKPGDTLTSGKIFESNSHGLQAALKQLDISPTAIEITDDEEEKIMNAIQRNLDADILILTGGVSVGDYDFVATALEKCCVQKVFHKVKQKPGKPFYFGIHNQTLVFALPGNPASVLTCFYEYVVDAIISFTNKKYFKRIQMPLTTEYSKKAGLTFFLKGKTASGTVSILEGQESYKMNSFAMADCIIELEEEKTEFKKSDIVNVLMID